MNLRAEELRDMGNPHWVDVLPAGEFLGLADKTVLHSGPPIASWQKLSVGVAVTTVGWLVATFVTRPEPESVQRRFKELVRADGRDAGKGVLLTFLVPVAIFASMWVVSLACS